MNCKSLHFAWVVDDGKCIVVTHVCVCVCVSVRGCMPTYCTDPDVTWGSGRGCPLVVHYWADLQLVHGLRCYGNITQTWNVSEYMLVLAVFLVSMWRHLSELRFHYVSRVFSLIFISDRMTARHVPMPLFRLLRGACTPWRSWPKVVSFMPNFTLFVNGWSVYPKTKFHEIL